MKNAEQLGSPLGNELSRREAIKAGAAMAIGAAATSGALLTSAEAQAPSLPAHPAAGPHKLPALGYAWDALEPHFDAKTMEIHHGKHHAAYVANLNRALSESPDHQKRPLEDLVKALDSVPAGIRTAVRNNGGGHLNHSLFWQCLTAASASGEPTGGLRKALDELFGSPEKMRERLAQAGLGVFGSGWVWISVEPTTKKLRLETTPNQDTPLMAGRQPLFGIDVWEHAYYLKYQNRRIDYLQAAMKVLNWKFIGERYEKLVG